MAKKSATSSFSFLRSVFPSSASAATVTMEPIEDAVVVDADLSSYWEFINASDADSSDTESLLSDENGFVSLHDSSSASPSLLPALLINAVPAPIEKQEREHEEEEESGIEEASKEAMVTSGVIVSGTGDLGRAFVERLMERQQQQVYDLYGGRLYGAEEVEEEEEEDEGDEYDELEQWNLGGKMAGKQRMRKVGKKGCQNKISNAKRNPYSYVKRGCAYGKREA